VEVIEIGFKDMGRKKFFYIGMLWAALVLIFIFFDAVGQSRLSRLIPSIAGTFHIQRAPGEGQEKYLAIIIDDFGSDRRGIKEMMSIDRHLTFAVMPFLEFSAEDAKTAHEKGYEVIVHLPMEPNKGKRSWLGPNPILAGMDSGTVSKITRDAIESIPFAVGANNHMGSKASSDEGIVRAVLEVIKEKNLYFVDSCTAAHPIAKKIASTEGVLCYDRDVFLDGQQPKSFVQKRLLEACDVAEKKGYAIAIGHVGIEGGTLTAQVIKEMLAEFDKRNIKLVFISELSKAVDGERTQ
jgi:polysaccharide deacetylase 2 family uncharacterized protein YibQ